MSIHNSRCWFVLQIPEWCQKKRKQNMWLLTAGWESKSLFWASSKMPMRSIGYFSTIPLSLNVALFRTVCSSVERTAPTDFHVVKSLYAKMPITPIIPARGMGSLESMLCSLNFNLHLNCSDLLMLCWTMVRLAQKIVYREIVECCFSWRVWIANYENFYRWYVVLHERES